jgi:AcrR family transcriptional regulator
MPDKERTSSGLVRSRTPVRGRRPGRLKVPRESGALVSEFQQSRILTSALEEAAKCGYELTTITAIVGHAGVSRKTFYELYESREGCFRALFQEAVTQIAELVAPLYTDGDGAWSERVRVALCALLGFLEGNRDLGAFVLEYAAEGVNGDAESRVWLLEALRRVIEDGASRPSARHGSSPLMAEVVVGGVLAVLHSRLQERSGHLMALVNPLMWTIVLPHLGPAAAAAELHRSVPRPAAVRRPTKPAADPLDDLEMRVTYRTARVLATVAERPGRSNVEIGADADVFDAGQISKLLARLEGYGLIENLGAGHVHGAPNEWRITRRGMEVDRAIRRRFAADSVTHGTQQA